jgi:hypothetical protein
MYNLITTDDLRDSFNAAVAELSDVHRAIVVGFVMRQGPLVMKRDICHAFNIAKVNQWNELMTDALAAVRVNLAAHGIASFGDALPLCD